MVIKHILTVNTGIAISRVLGLFREILMAATFGTSLIGSAFYTAFRIPNLFRAIFGEGALTAAFLPVYRDALEHDDRQHANQLAGSLVTLLTITLGTLVLMGIIGIQLLRPLWGDVPRVAAVLPLLQIMLPYLLFICIAAMFTAMLNAMKRFAVAALSPALLNVIWIAALLCMIPFPRLADDRRVQILALAILLAGWLQAFVQALALWRTQRLPRRLIMQWSDKTKSTLKAFGPAALTMGIREINVLIDTLLAIAISAAAPAALNFAERLIYLPLGLFVTAVATVLLPTLSEHITKQQQHRITHDLNQALTWLLTLMTPLAIAIMLLAYPLVRFVYEAGVFNAQSTTLTARALIAYAPALIVFTFYKLLVPVFYALKDTRTPMYCGIAAVALNLILNVTFILTLPQGWKHAGLALGTVLTGIVHCIALGTLLKKRIEKFTWHNIRIRFTPILIASAIMAAGIHMILAPLQTAFAPLPIKIQQGLLLTTTGFAGLCIYALSLFVLDRHHLANIFNDIKNFAHRKQ